MKHPKDKGKRHSLRHKTPRSHCKRLAVALEAFYQGINLALAHRILFGQYGHSIRDFFILIQQAGIVRIQVNIPELEKRIEQYQRDMEQSRQEYEKPFTQEEELNEKVARLNELNVQLDLENGKTEDVDLCEEQDNARVAEPENYHCFPSGEEGR